MTTKRAGELQPGDAVIVAGERRVVEAVKPHDRPVDSAGTAGVKVWWVGREHPSLISVDKEFEVASVTAFAQYAQRCEGGWLFRLPTGFDALVTTDGEPLRFDVRTSTDPETAARCGAAWRASRPELRSATVDEVETLLAALMGPTGEAP